MFLWRRIAGRLLLLVLGGLAVVGSGCNAKGKAKELVGESRTALQRGKYEDAQKLAERALNYDSDLPEALLLAGQAAEKLNQPQEALRYFELVTDGNATQKSEALASAGRILLRELHRLQAAETRLRAALELNPRNVAAHDQLAYLLSLAGRRWESRLHYLALIQQDRYQLGHLLGLADLDVILFDPAELERCLTQAPQDPLPLLGQARSAMLDNRAEAAERLLRQALAEDPTLVEAHVRLGLLLAESANDSEWEAWLSAAPPETQGHPEYWIARAKRAQAAGQTGVAARCFGEAMQRDPNRQMACYQLSQLGNVIGENAAAGFAQRSTQLLQLKEVVNKLQEDRDNLELMLRVATEAETLGRYWEAWAWRRLVLRFDRQRLSVEADVERLAAVLDVGTPQTIATANPITLVDLAALPTVDDLPDAHSPRSDEPADAIGSLPIPVGEAAISFRDDAAAAGVDFQYYNGHDTARQAVRLYEVDGGGVAVLDYDADGWPDLYFTQGCRWPPDPNQREFLDRLFRNLGKGRFEDVTESAGLAEAGFGQGVAVGDWDNDGFPDLLVANIGRNRLFHNQGDGTFRDITDQVGLNENRWTSSVMLADLTNDGLPDLYEVNYLQGKDVFERVCPDGRGSMRLCPPVMFPASPDQLYVNRGDGTLAPAGETARIRRDDGRGLGIVAGRIENVSGLAIFVANDVVENFLFVPRPSSDGGPQYDEEGMLRGVALDAEGQGQASMGVAADDVDLDGRLDLFVTNFYRESNTLYLQQPGGYFVDATRRAGLRDGSYLMLGFGTEFLDAQLDGWPDLVLANGHLVDETDLGVPYRMRPQFYQNLGNGRFQERTEKSLGPYFETPQLGRALATLDWNRDGREDFVVSHLDTPVSLLTNTSEPAGHFLAVRLCGVVSSRDAVGAEVRVRAGKYNRVRQVLGGSGYQAANQQQLVFGLGSHQRVEELEVSWPSGLVQTWSDLPADQELLLIESQAEAIRLPR